MFKEITDIDFLSSTKLICTDKRSHCLRLVDLSLSPPKTSTLAGLCTKSGNSKHLYTARLDFPTYTEVKSDKSTLFVLERTKTIRMVDLRSSNGTVLVTFNTQSKDMKLLGDNLLYFAQGTRVIVFDINTREERVVTGGEGSGITIGSFEHTRFENPYGFLVWEDEMNTLLLVADFGNNRFVFFLQLKGAIS